MIDHMELRKAFSEFWDRHGHKLVTPAPLVLSNDPTTLFNSSGMQQLIPYLQGEKHPQGVKLYNIQPCFRAVDIDEVGDNRHTTFFEMMGNWSLGDYFKKEQLPLFWEFLTKVLHLPEDKLYVSVFEGYKNVPKDEESYKILKSLDIPENHFYFYGVDKNWWSRSGAPDQMPPGEIGGPDSEVFYDFGTPHDKKYGEKCHPNCECGRFLEIGNSVFIQYRKNDDGSLEELPQKNVDFGGGLERIVAAVNNLPDIYLSDLYKPVIKIIAGHTSHKYEENKAAFQVITDHLKAAVFMIGEGVRPANKEQGYLLRRLLRRAAVKIHELGGEINDTKHKPSVYWGVTETIINMYRNVYLNSEIISTTVEVIEEEMKRFEKSLQNGLKEIKKISPENITGHFAFNLYQNFGFPYELTEELLRQKGFALDRNQFRQEFEKHRTLSRTASAGKFKGGLADHSEKVIKYHTATHLIHQALFDVLGNDIRQEGSNITGERLRFDFSTNKIPGQEDIKKVQEIAREKIDEGLPMTFTMMPRDEAFKLGARSFFREKYPEQVKIYYIGENLKDAYSKEFCGGPHVKNTREIGKIDIYKFEKIGSNLYRIYAK